MSLPNIIQEIEGVKQSFMHEIKILFGNNLLAAKKFELEQENIQAIFTKIQVLVGPQYTPKVLRLYADMLERLNDIGAKFKSELEGRANDTPKHE